MPLNRWMSLDPDISTEDARVSEVHHRIANNLAFVAGYARLQGAELARAGAALSAAEAQAVLESVGARIDTVARLNRLLSQRPQADRIDIGAFITATCEALKESIGGSAAVEIRCQCAPCVVDWRLAEGLGMIVTELVANAIKYAHPAGAPGVIEVGCRDLGHGRLEVRVSDDGVGLPEGFVPTTDGGLGMRVIRALARQLGAEVRFDSGALGLTTRVTVSRTGRVGPAISLAAG